MKVAILCPGPSLVRTWPSEHVYDCFLGVNRAVLAAPCDWWVAGDWMYLKETPAQPRIGYCTIADVIRHIREDALIPAERLSPSAQFVAWEDLPFQRTYSTVAAFGLAAHLGATRVDVYGDDKSGTADFDGREGENRGLGRWEEELQATAAAIAFLAARNIPTRHIRG